MRALIDADTPIFAAAVSSLDKELWVATSRLDASIHKLIEGSQCDEYTLFVSGGRNFRYDIDPNYKAQRGADPEHREACRQHLINEWGAVETQGYEADDAVGCEQDPEGSTVICGIDKDLLMIPGKHYQWPIWRQGKIVRPEQTHFITYEQGLKTFFTQVLTGDPNDNIGTYFDPASKTWKKEKYLLSQKKAEKLLEGCKGEEEMYKIVYDFYTEDGESDGDMNFLESRLVKNMDLLWIWRSLGETYSIRREQRE